MSLCVVVPNTVLTTVYLFNFHHNSERSTLKAAAKTPNHEQPHFYGIQEELMSRLAWLPREGVCVGMLRWRESASERSEPSSYLCFPIP